MFQTDTVDYLHELILCLYSLFNSPGYNVLCVCSVHARPGVVRQRHRLHLHPVGQEVRQADFLSVLQPGPLQTEASPTDTVNTSLH